MDFLKTTWTTDEDRSIEGQFSHNVPMGVCPRCQVGAAAVAIHYPWINLRKIFKADMEKRLRYGNTRIRGYTYVTEWDEIQAVRNELRQHVDPCYPLPPGTKFGVYKGKIFSRPPITDLVMPGMGTLIGRKRVIDRLNDLGFNLKTFAVQLTPGKTDEELVYIWAPPVGRSGSQARIAWCNECDRGTVSKVDVIDKSSVPEDTHLFVIRDIPDFIVLSAELVAAIEANGFSGLKLSPILSE